MSQTQPDNPFRPGSGIFPPLLAGREHETQIAMARLARTREGHPHHTALLGEWAIGKTTLLNLAETWANPGIRPETRAQGDPRGIRADRGPRA